jgi:hypothetical protein
MKPFTLIAAVIFLMVAAAHIYRAATGLTVVIDGHDIPMAVSWVAAAVSALIGVMLFAESRR